MNFADRDSPSKPQAWPVVLSVNRLRLCGRLTSRIRVDENTVHHGPKLLLTGIRTYCLLRRVTSCIVQVLLLYQVCSTRPTCYLIGYVSWCPLMHLGTTTAVHATTWPSRLLTRLGRRQSRLVLLSRDRLTAAD